MPEKICQGTVKPLINISTPACVSCVRRPLKEGCKDTKNKGRVKHASSYARSLLMYKNLSTVNKLVLSIRLI